MFKSLVALWVVLSVGLVAWHFGPRSNAATLTLGECLEKARAAEKSEDWKEVLRLYARAQALCPDSDFEQRLGLWLAYCFAQINDDELPAARSRLKEMLGQAKEQGVSTDLEVRIRELLAKSSYDMALQLRMEDADRDLWMESAEAACEQYQYLANSANDIGLEGAADYQKNLEAAVRLTRDDSSLLSGMPFPPTCWSTSNCNKKAQYERDRLARQRPGKDSRSKLDGGGGDGSKTEGKGW